MTCADTPPLMNGIFQGGDAREMFGKDFRHQKWLGAIDSGDGWKRFTCYGSIADRGTLR